MKNKAFHENEYKVPERWSAQDEKIFTFLISAFIGMLLLAGCSKTTGTGESAEGGSISDMPHIDNSTETEQAGQALKRNLTDIEGLATNQQAGSIQTAEGTNPDAFPVGAYHDDMGSQLIIYKIDDKNYMVSYGIYKLTYMENAAAHYDVNSGRLSFSGIDDNGNQLSADVTLQGDDLAVALTHSAYPDCPAGTIFQFEPDESQLEMDEYSADSIYIGEYLDYDSNEPNLEIAKGNDGTYVVQIGIYRLTSLDDGIGELTPEGMLFTATDAAGNPICGVITVKKQIATVTFTDSTWSLLENGSTFKYSKTSDTPNIRTEW